MQMKQDKTEYRISYDYMQRDDKLNYGKVSFYIDIDDGEYFRDALLRAIIESNIGDEEIIVFSYEFFEDSHMIIKTQHGEFDIFNICTQKVLPAYFVIVRDDNIACHRLKIYETLEEAEAEIVQMVIDEEYACEEGYETEIESIHYTDGCKGAMWGLPMGTGFNVHLWKKDDAADCKKIFDWEEVREYFIVAEKPPINLFRFGG